MASTRIVIEADLDDTDTASTLLALAADLVSAANSLRATDAGDHA